MIDQLEPNADIWVEDLARRTRTRVTTDPSRDLGHVWSPDGLRLAYRPDVDDRRRLSIIAADGSGAAQDLICPTAYCEPTDWSSDGRELLVNTYERDGTDVWAVAIASGGTSRPLLHTLLQRARRAALARSALACLCLVRSRQTGPDVREWEPHQRLARAARGASTSA